MSISLQIYFSVRFDLEVPWLLLFRRFFTSSNSPDVKKPFTLASSKPSTWQISRNAWNVCSDIIFSTLIAVLFAAPNAKRHVEGSNLAVIILTGRTLSRIPLRQFSFFRSKNLIFRRFSCKISYPSTNPDWIIPKRMLCIQYEDLLLEISTVVIAIANRKFNIVREVKEPDPSRSIRNPVEQEIDLLKEFPKKIWLVLLREKYCNV